ncbi:hypothetical protein SprV_0200723100 [Sparganum proliferum]
MPNAKLANYNCPRVAGNANDQPLSTCPRYQRTFWAPIGLIKHLRNQCAIKTTTFSSLPTLAPAANSKPAAIPVTAVLTVAAPPPSSVETTRPPPTAATTITISTRITRTTAPRTPSPTRRRPTSNRLHTSPTSPHPAMWTRFIPFLIAIAPSPCTSTWSVICESRD